MRIALAVLLPMVLLASGVCLLHFRRCRGHKDRPRPPMQSPLIRRKANDTGCCAKTRRSQGRARRDAVVHCGQERPKAGAAAKASQPPKTAAAGERTADRSARGRRGQAGRCARLPPQKPAVKMPPLKGSHIKDDDNTCLQCHTNADAWDPKDKAQYRFYLALDALKKDVHYQKGVNCVDCHGGDPTVLEPKAHQTDDFRSKLPEIQKFCAHCHDKEVAVLIASPHKGVQLHRLPCHG